MFASIVRHLPPAAKYTLRLLEFLGPLSHTDIVKETMLSSRTIGNALSVLLENGLVKKEISKTDRRIKIYSMR